MQLLRFIDVKLKTSGEGASRIIDILQAIITMSFFIEPIPDLPRLAPSPNKIDQDQ